MRTLASYFRAFLPALFLMLAAVTLPAISARAQTAAVKNSPAQMAPDSSMHIPGNAQAPVSGRPQSPVAGTADQAGAGTDAKPPEKAKPNIIIKKERDPFNANDETAIMELIASMPEGIQEEVMKESKHARNFCEYNGFMMNFYDCSCFSLRIAKMRIQLGPEIPFINLVQDGKYKECVDMGLIAGYGLDRCNRALTMANFTTGQLNSICDCAGRSLAHNYAQNPIPHIIHVNRQFDDILAMCRQMSGL